MKTDQSVSNSSGTPLRIVPNAPPRKKELLLGCGENHNKQMFILPDTEWHNVTTLDWNPAMGPDVVWDLENIPLPFEDNSFDEIHAYQVLEHLSTQGDFKFFFAQFEDFWRLLKPNGLFIASVPMWNSIWAWGDPSHRRVISQASLAYLSQHEYERQVGVTQMTDFRHIWHGNFQGVHFMEKEGSFDFILQAVK